MGQRLEGDFHFAGTLSATTVRLPDGTVDNAKVAASADIDHTKLEHQHRASLSQNGTAASVTVPLAAIRGAAGTILSVRAGTITACTGNATITVDVKKNGVTVLTAVITLDNANTARVVEAGTLSVTSLAAGDFLEAVVVATVGTGVLGTGLHVEVRWAEDAS